MITCPWCGTNYTTFRSNCSNCGGSLPLPAAQAPAPVAEALPVPPPPPRSVPNNVAWRILSADGWAITAMVFVLLGAIFGLVGLALTISIVAIFVGLPFTGLGLLFLAAGVPIFVWRYSDARQTVDVLLAGQSVLGEILNVQQNYHVRVNNRFPWTILYRFVVDGRSYEGKVTTLSTPDLGQQPGKPVYVLYLRDDPEQNTLYPTPYGYFSL